MRRLLFIPLCLVLVSCSHAQKQDAKAVSLLDHARSISGLERTGLPAYRLHATFTTYDDKGQQDGSGTVMQTGAPDGRIKRVVTFRDQTVTSVRTDEWHEVADEEYLETFSERRLLDAVFNPLPEAKDLSQRSISLRPFKAGNTNLQCAVVSVPVPDERDSNAALPSKAYCMDEQVGMVRMIVGHGGRSIVLNSMYPFGTINVSGDISVVQKGVKRGQLHIDKFEKLNEVSPADFVLPPPTEGQSDASRITVDTNLIKGTVLSKTAPRYPEFAKSQRISGTVTLNVIIGRDGRIRDMDLLTAPDDSLANAAFEAVKTWRYKPYLHEGKPVEVESIITVNFFMTH